MSKREVHLCDTPECDEKYYKTCPLCDIERCLKHFGGPNYVSVGVGLRGAGASGVDLGECDTINFCSVCRTRLAAIRPKLDYLVEPVKARMMEALRAAMAGAALAAEGAK